MPREPVTFFAVIDGVEGEWDASDNFRQCPLGAQSPTDLRCRVLATSESLTVALEWENAGEYERIQIYRDGAMLSEVSGDTTSFVDPSAALHESGTDVVVREYCLRACAKLSRSVRSLPCVARIDLSDDPPVDPVFRRADANADGGIDLSDAVFTLNHLFLGGREPPCRDAANANGDPNLDISDAVYTLTYLFLGGREPPAPFEGCGESPFELRPDCVSFAPCTP